MNMIIGITGGIGSGKSAVSQYLTGNGEYVICADEVARQAVLPNATGAQEIRRVFGDSFFADNGTLLRKKLANHVFADKKQLSKLDDILHPIIIESMFKQANKASGRVFLDAALLIKSKMYKRVDYVWLIVADEKVRIDRVIKRDSSSKKVVQSRIEKQMCDKEMLPFADEIIENHHDITKLYAAIDDILAKPIYNEESR